MNVITIKEFEERFEEIIDDVSINKKHYCVQIEDGKDVMVLPADVYYAFQDIYEDWLGHPQNNELEDFDHKPLPVTYLGEAEPPLLS